MSELAIRANERRKHIREIITDINGPSDQCSNSVEPANPLPGAVDQHGPSDQCSNSVEPANPLPGAVDQHGPSDQCSNSVEPANPLPRAVDQLSDPTFYRNLPFPSVFAVVPNRFKDDGKAQGNWPYMGRTKFKELLQTLNNVRKDRSRTTAWLYGTQGYGKSHLLAALVCYLAAQDERVVYIPDCRVWLLDVVGYMQAAMLFAWAGNIDAQRKIEKRRLAGLARRDRCRAPPGPLA